MPMQLLVGPKGSLRKKTIVAPLPLISRIINDRAGLGIDRRGRGLERVLKGFGEGTAVRGGSRRRLEETKLRRSPGRRVAASAARKQGRGCKLKS